MPSKKTATRRSARKPVADIAARASALGTVRKLKGETGRLDSISNGVPSQSPTKSRPPRLREPAASQLSMVDNIVN